MNTPPEHHRYDIRCPRCGRVESKTLGWIGWNKTYECTCGAAVDAANQLADIEMKQIKEMTADINQKITEMRQRDK